jgi:hypothetical protein
VELVFKTLQNKSQYKFALITFFPLGEKEGSAIQSSFLLAIKRFCIRNKRKRFCVEYGKGFVRPTSKLERLLWKTFVFISKTR